MKIYETTIKYRDTGLRTESAFRKLDKPSLVAEYMAGVFDENPFQEQVWLIFLNRKYAPMGRLLLTVGTLTSALITPREVFSAACKASAASIILCHTHPSGDPSPSSADFKITRQIMEASEIMGIEVTDHVIIGQKSDDPMGRGYYSFREAGSIPGCSERLAACAE
jgi:DNA repair protein RadC